VSAGVSHQGEARLRAIGPLGQICEHVRLRALLRAEWLRHCSTETGDRGLHDPLSEARFYGARAELSALRVALAHLEEVLDDPETPHPLHHLARSLDLTEPERDLLQLCAALETDPELGPLLGRLGRTWPCESLCRRLFGHPSGPLFPVGASIWRWRLVLSVDAAPGEEPAFRLDPIVREWLAGESSIEPELQGILRAIPLRDPLNTWPIEQVASRVLSPLRARAHVRLRVVGPSRSGRHTFAALVADTLGVETARIRGGLVDAESWPERLRRALRTCAVLGLAPVLDAAALARPWPADLPLPALTFAACDVDDPVAAAPDDVVDLAVHVPELALGERAALWSSFAPNMSTWPKEQVDVIVRYPLMIGEICDLGRRGADDPATLAEACRELGRGRLGELGRLLPTPFSWDDLVLRPELFQRLRDFAFEARERAAFWEDPRARRLFPRGTGLTALLTGPPGTGKTMATQVLAQELGLDLYRVDLAALISKYIGETAKNLRKIFTAAARLPAILLFDEADALFTRRTEVRDAHDRWANADTNYLLQLLEEYRGIALLASNRRENIDGAFTRRIRYVFDFPRPDPRQRRVLWIRVLELLGDVAPLESALDHLAVLDLSGAQIKSTVLAAAFAARADRSPITPHHLIRGLERELDKDGRYLSPQERERLVRCA